MSSHLAILPHNLPEDHVLPIQVFRLGAVSGFFMSEMVQPSAARLAEKDEELRVVPEKIPSQSIPRDMNHYGFVSG